MRPVPLPPGWGVAALLDAAEAATAWPDATRSYDHGGACLAWRAPQGHAAACDMERLDKDTGTLPFTLRDWVALESDAKLHDVPVVLWAKGAGRAGSTPSDLLVQEWGGRVLAFRRRPA